MILVTTLEVLIISVDPSVVVADGIHIWLYVDESVHVGEVSGGGQPICGNLLIDLCSQSDTQTITHTGGE